MYAVKRSQQDERSFTRERVLTEADLQAVLAGDDVKTICQDVVSDLLDDPSSDLNGALDTRVSMNDIGSIVSNAIEVSKFEKKGKKKKREIERERERERENQGGRRR